MSDTLHTFTYAPASDPNSLKRLSSSRGINHFMRIIFVKHFSGIQKINSLSPTKQRKGLEEGLVLEDTIIFLIHGPLEETIVNFFDLDNQTAVGC
ncbi:3172_t:CDS:2 [Acaulospora colombiana]|nr:3172_t:CDS:2 [Acaulospora colombiana]